MASQSYLFKNTLNIFKNIVIPESQNSKSVLTKACITLLIIQMIFCMLATIKFNDQLWVE